MNFPFFIARRYLFARKSQNVINTITAISMAGIMLASFALICTLSVFNGFHELVATLFTEFDPEIKVVSNTGKTFHENDPRIQEAIKSPVVQTSTFSLEEQALLQYKGRQQIAIVKGVETAFHDMTGIEKILRGSGIFMLEDDICDYMILGVGLMGRMDCGIQPAYPIKVYIPKRGGKVSTVNPAASFNSADVYSPGVIFQVNQQKYDDTYALISLDLARELTDSSDGASALEIKLNPDYGIRRAKRELSRILGSDFDVLDRYEQQADVFKVVRIEKFISYLFLSFILLIACFNIIGSLIMLMIEKRGDIGILRSLGATEKTVSRIFVTNGVLISVIGAISGLLLGVIAAFLQQKFGFISLGTQGAFVVDSYPVKVELADVLTVLVTVCVVSYITVRPISKLTRRLFR